MMTPQLLQDAIDTYLGEDGHVPDGWLVVFLRPATPGSLEESANSFARFFKVLSKSHKMLVGGDRPPYRPRPHILHRVVVKNAREERYDYFFFPEDEVIISGCWDLVFPVMFPRTTEIGWLQEAAAATGMTLLPPEVGDE